jgi:hypothetical protein
MTAPTLEAMAASVAPLRGVLLFTLSDGLPYRSWQRPGASWDNDLDATRFGDLLRTAYPQVGQPWGADPQAQVTIESGATLAILRPLSDTVAAVLLFDGPTPLGLARFHVARMLDGLRSLTSELGHVAPSRRAFEVAPLHAPSTPPLPIVRLPTPPPPAPVAAPPAERTAERSTDLPIAAPLPFSAPPAPPAGARRPAPTLTSAESAPLPLSRMMAESAVKTPPYPPAVPSDAEKTFPIRRVEEDEGGVATTPRGPLPIFTPPPGTRPPPPPPRDPSLARGAQLVSYLEEHTPDAHVARQRLALQTGIPLSSLNTPERLGHAEVIQIEAAVRRILGLDPSEGG